MKISIIVPVYNVEDYLRQCLDSCVHQNLQSSDYEIIIVNDGSPDNSHEIIKEFDNKYKNIVVINKENGGLSSARNAGFRIAKGDFIWFVDSDDWIQENCLCKVLEGLTPKIDLLALNTYLCKSNEQKPIIRDLKVGPLYEGKDIFYRSFIYPYSAVQFYIFNRQFLKDYGILFKEGIVYEDILYTPIVLSIAKACICYKEPVYYYRIRENSITSSAITEKKN